MRTCKLCGEEFDSSEGEYFNELDGGSWLCTDCTTGYQDELEEEKEKDQQLEADALGSGLFGVAKTSFHGGGILGENLSALEAIELRDEFIGDTDCACGCAGVFRMDEPPKAYSPDNRDPYSLAS